MGDVGKRAELIQRTDRSPLISHHPRTVGRDRELSVIYDAITDAIEGRGRVVVLEGEAGVGKTRLVHEAVRFAGSVECTTVQAAADELESDRPFAPFLDAFDDVHDVPEDLVRHFRSLARGETGSREDPLRDGGSRYRAVDALIDLIEAIALNHPVVLSIEDLHWADKTSMLATNRLARRLREFRAVLLLSLRPFPRDGTLTKVLANVDRMGGRTVFLEPLDEDGALELATELAGASPGPNLVEKISTTVGNPLFITELINALAMEGRLTVADGIAETDAADIPASLRLTLLRRLAFLSDETLDILRSAAVLGSTFTLSALSVTSGRSVGDLRNALHEAVASGLVIDRDDAIAFKHDLVRSALYEDLPRGVRRSLHHEAGMALATSGHDPVAAAPHLAIGAEPGDLAAVDVLEQAARGVSHSDPRVAADLLQTALDLAGWAEPDLRSRLLVDRTFALLWAGAMEEAEPAAEAALASNLEVTADAEMRIAMTRGCIIQGRLFEAESHVNAGLALDKIAPELRANLLVERCFICLFTGRFDEMDALAQEAIELAKIARDVAPHALSLTALGLRSLLQGRVQEALSTAQEVLAFRDPTGRLQRHAATLLVPIILIEADRLDDAEEVLRRGIRYNETAGSPWLLPSYHGGVGRIHLAKGDWDAAVAELETSLELADETGNTGSNPLVLSLLGEIALHRGDLDTCERNVSAAEVIVAEYGGMHWHAGDAMDARAKLLEAQGDVEGVAAVLGNLWTLREAAGLHGANQSIAVRLTRASVRLGDVDRARNVSAAAQRVAAGIGTATANGWAHHATGLAEGDSARLVDAVESLRDSPRVLELASACEDAAEAIAATGKNDEAKNLLADAAQIYGRVGAEFDLHRVNSRLRALGVRRGPSSPHAQARSGWESLTPTENKIAELVAEGLRNREIASRLFLSVRTIETHLSHVYDKLGVRSRTQLVSSFPGDRSGQGSRKKT